MVMRRFAGWIFFALVCFVGSSCKTRPVGDYDSALTSIDPLKYRFGAGMRGVSSVKIEAGVPGFHQLANGLRIEKLSSGGPAQKCGFTVGDVVTKINRTDVATPEGWDDVIQKLESPQVVLTFVRNGKESEKKCTLSSDSAHDSSSGSSVGSATKLPNSDVFDTIAANATKENPELRSDAEDTVRKFPPEICNKGTHSIFVAEALKQRMDIVRKLRIHYCMLVVGKLEM